MIVLVSQSLDCSTWVPDPWWWCPKLAAICGWWLTYSALIYCSRVCENLLNLVVGSYFQVVAVKRLRCYRPADAALIIRSYFINQSLSYLHSSHCLLPFLLISAPLHARYLDLVMCFLSVYCQPLPFYFIEWQWSWFSG